MQLKQSCQILTSCLHSQFGITRSPPPNSGWGAIRAAQNIERIPTVDVRAHAKEGAQLGSTSHLCSHLTRAICVATLNCAHSPTMLRSVGTLATGLPKVKSLFQARACAFLSGRTFSPGICWCAGVSSSGQLSATGTIPMVSGTH